MPKQYVTAKELREEIINSNALGRPSDKLVKQAELIFSRRLKSFNLQPTDKEDAIQASWELFLRNWHRIDSKKNIFSYITCIANSGVTQVLRQKRMRELSNSNLFDGKDNSL